MLKSTLTSNLKSINFCLNRTFCSTLYKYPVNKKLLSNQNDNNDKTQHLYLKFSTSNIYLNKEWNNMLTKAEKVVGYPTSFLNLRYLVSDEVAHFANLLRKLMQTKHPLIKMARKLVTNSDSKSKRNLQINGLIVLLISKAAGVPKKVTKVLESEISDGIANSQRCLAEIAEMIYMGSLIHKGVLDLKHVSEAEHKDMDQGNKLAVLCGDYLLASACTNLSKLHNTEVVDLMSQVIADISQGIFKNPNPKFTFLKIWYDKVNSDSSSLLAHSAKSAMILVDHSPKVQDTAWDFATNLDVTYKIWSELNDFKKDENILNNPDSILAAIYKDKYEKRNQSGPSPLADKDHKSGKLYSPSTFSSFYASFMSDAHQNKIDQNIINDIKEDCKDLFKNHYNFAMQNLDELNNENSEQEAIMALKSMLNIMKSTL